MHFRIILFAATIFITTAVSYAQEEYLYELAEIEFKGNEEIPTGELKSIIYSEETPWWFYKFVNSIISSFGKEAVYFDSSEIKIDLESLEAYYKANGFFNAHFAYSYVRDTTSKEVVLTYTITENAQSKYRNINFIGIDNLPEHIHRRVIAEKQIDSGEVYRQFDVEQSISHTLEVLLNRGYMLVKHDSTVVFVDSVNNAADLNLYFRIGERYKISDVIVNKKGEGAEHVSDDLIIYLVDVERDEYYNLEKIKTTQNRLARTGLFNSLILDASKKDTTGDHVPLRVEGNIGLMNEFQPGIAINNEFDDLNFIINGNYTRKNFFGNARKLSLTTEVGIIDIRHFSLNEFFSAENYNIDGYASVNLKIEQPYLFQKPILGVLENYFQTATFSLVNEKTYGTKISFDFEQPYYTFINQLKPYYNLEFYEAKVKDIYNPDFALYYHSAALNTTTSFIGVQIGSAKANNIFYPTGGTNQQLNLETAVSYATYNVDVQAAVNVGDTSVVLTGETENILDSQTALFYRIEYTSTYYLPLSADRSSVFAAKGKLGYIQAYKGDASLIPFNRTFFVGGSNSVRGWGARYFPSLQDELEFDPTDFLNVILPDNSEERKLRGGTFLFEGSFEYRKRFLETLGAVLFFDYGNAWNGYKSFRLDELALALGFGFRYYSSIAPFRIDFGFKFYDPDSKLFIWEGWNKKFWQNLTFHFGIGEAF